jgi:tRNA uridine 5-carboxymethylaminomethyl modification enzyme
LGDLGDSLTLAQLSQRQNVTHEMIHALLPHPIRQQTSYSDLETSLADLLYCGYIDSQNESFDRLFHNDNLRLPVNLDFHTISGLSHEMVERLQKAKPQNFGQARRIPGMTPAALSILLVRLKLNQAA